MDVEWCLVKKFFIQVYMAGVEYTTLAAPETDRRHDFSTRPKLLSTRCCSLSLSQSSSLTLFPLYLE